jgi:hypothetical protein
VVTAEASPAIGAPLAVHPSVTRPRAGAEVKLSLAEVIAASGSGDSPCLLTLWFSSLTPSSLLAGAVLSTHTPPACWPGTQSCCVALAVGLSLTVRLLILDIHVLT